MVSLFNKIFCGLLEYIIKSNVAVTQNKGSLFPLQRAKAVNISLGNKKGAASRRAYSSAFILFDYRIRWI